MDQVEEGKEGRQQGKAQPHSRTAPKAGVEGADVVAGTLCACLGVGDWAPGPRPLSHACSSSQSGVLVPGLFFLATLIPVILAIPGSPDTSVCTLSPSHL